MARIRSIKPQAFTSESLATRSRDARWAFAGLWTYCDDDGYGKADPRLIKGALFPLDDDVTPSVVTEYLDELSSEDDPLICRYEVDGRAYLHVLSWEHQSINKPTPTKLPQCPHHDHPTDPASSPNELGYGDSRSATGEVREDYRGEQGTGNREQGSGTGTETETPSPDPADADALVLVTADAVTVHEPTFEDFWALYPKKRDRADALRAWPKAIRKVSPQVIVDAARRLRDDPNLPALTFVPHGATWLNGEKWNNPPYPPRQGAQPARHQSQGHHDGIALAMRERAREEAEEAAARGQHAQITATIHPVNSTRAGAA